MSNKRASWGWLWTVAAAIALLWPARISGPFDGAPLDQFPEAVLVGLVLPALCWFHPRFLTTRIARGCIVAILAWKGLATIAFVQDGWCVRFAPSAPLAKDATGAPHSWDLRADWRSADPSCSAIMTRRYDALSKFPAWFFNLPPPNDSWPSATDRPPGATTPMTATGFINARQTGVLQVVTGPDVAAALNVDGGSILREEQERRGVMLAPGVHRIVVETVLKGDRWQFVPLWNGTDLWSASMATVQRPSRLDVAVRPWAKWIGAGLVLTLALAWIASAVARIGNADVLAWLVGVSCCVALLAATGSGDLGRWAVAALLGATLLHVPTRLRNAYGAFVLIGIPWLTLVAVMSAPYVGRFTIYDVGSDHWMFQRFAYRIVMQGYWLEGGSETFWFQPFYRWIVGALHLIFGDSSVGEWYWDAACVLVMAMFSFHVTRAFAGFRWGLVAAVATLTVFTLGTTWAHLGRGLSEISSAGLLSLAALVALKSRHRSWRLALAAGVFATLAFFTRLNNLPMAVAVAVFALPVRQPIRTALRPRAWMARASWPTAIGVTLTLCLGLLLFAWRTWHYTGVFSVFYGTQRDLLAIWQPGVSLGTLLERMAGSVMMVLTMNDPARFDVYALPLLAGALVSLLATIGVPRLRELPLGPVVFCLSALVAPLVARGSAYPGRFSVHLIGVSCAVVACAAALISEGAWRDGITRTTRSRAGDPAATSSSVPPN
jgi:hypothetical protein